MVDIRMTQTTQAVLRVLLEDPAARRYGLEIGAVTGLPSGTIHPILGRLENLGWVESDWEDIDPSAAARPRRRYYRISQDGLAAARLALARAHQTRTTLVSRPWAVGDTS
jgi:PadR family transcriptional regulator, regulatory protein PadR